MEAHESTRKRLESTHPRNHEDHIDEQGFNSISHHYSVQKYIPMLQAMPLAMKIPDAKAAVDKECSRSCPHGNWIRWSRWTSVISTMRSWNQRTQNQRTKKYKGRVVLRGDIGAYAAFTEQGSSPSQMTAAKVMNVIAQAADAVSRKMEDAPRLFKNPNSECPDVVDTSSTTQVAQIWAKHRRPHGFSRTKFVQTPARRLLLGLRCEK